MAQSTISQRNDLSLTAEFPRPIKKARIGDGGGFSFAAAGNFAAESEVKDGPDTRGSWTLKFTTS
jgi:hypothetical protein